MGIVNCTPDSFSDGGTLASEADIARRLSRIVEEGGDIADIGGESTRPGSDPVSAAIEWERIAPAFAAARRERIPIALSVDTMKPEVARRALAEGAVIVNDISGLRAGPAIAEDAAAAGAGLVLMHMQGDPKTMQVHPQYGDLIGEVRESLERSVLAAERSGVPRERILVDPGIGFGKTLDMNIELLRGASLFGDLAVGVLIGTSRKGFLGKLTGDAPVADRLESSVASFTAAVLAGAHAIRVHDVKAGRRAAQIADALRGGGAAAC